MKTMKQVMLPIVITLLAVAAKGQTNTSAEDAVRAADAAWDKTYEAKDLDKAVAFCDEQASLLWPNSPVATGKNAITKLTASAFAIPDFKLVWHPDKVVT